MSKPRALYIVRQFPQMSETYIKSEIEAISDEFEVLVITSGQADLPYKNHAPYHLIYEWSDIESAIEEFRPHVMHSHWLYRIWNLEHFARKTNTPYTVRAHSFDMLIDPEHHFEEAVHLINDDLCLGVLTFPFGRAPLEKLGVKSEKIHDCYPVVNYKRFYDRSPNGDAVMNVGACLPKKKMEDYLLLASQARKIKFNYYPLSYDTPEFIKLNEQIGNPVDVHAPVEPEEMPAEYKKHRWLVYTASHEIGTVGWPMSIAEAQASGVGVCMANLRPDLREYIGGAGFLFHSISEVLDIISKPYPEEMREIGFEQAKKSDIYRHKSILLNLWKKAVSA